MTHPNQDCHTQTGGVKWQQQGDTQRHGIIGCFRPLNLETKCKCAVQAAQSNACRHVDNL